MKVPIMDQLHQDHVNYSNLLKLLNKYIDALSKGGDKGYLEMYLIVNYMKRYPDIFHHPYEDIIFEEVGKIDHDLDALIKGLHNEHKKLADRSQILLDELNAVVNGHILEREKIREAAREYADLLTEHMNMEEAKVFPFIIEKMSKSNWDNISDKIKHVKDPIFGEVVADEFKLLYAQIIDA